MAAKLLYLPLKRILLRDVDHISNGPLELGVLHVVGHRHVDINIIGDALLFVVGLNFDEESDFGLRGFFYNDVD